MTVAATTFSKGDKVRLPKKLDGEIGTVVHSWTGGDGIERCTVARKVDGKGMREAVVRAEDLEAVTS